MAEGCAFEGSCPMGKDIIDISGPCSNKQGEKCGPVAAFGMLTYEKDGLLHADDEDPIVGTFTFTSVPAGDPPLHVREEWLGVEVPVRHPHKLSENEIPVASDDVELSLLSQGKLEAASWFISLAFRQGKYTATFRASEGVTTEIESNSSMDYYGSRLSPEARAAIENS